MTHKIYRALESTIQFTDSTGDYTLALSGLPANSGRNSVGVDRGVGSLPYRYKWRAVIQWNVTPVAGDLVDIYLIESDGTYVDGVVDLSVGGTFTDGQSLNIQHLGTVSAQSAVAATDFIASGVCKIFDRYFGMGVFNRSSRDLNTVSNTSRVLVTPIPDEIQDAA